MREKNSKQKTSESNMFFIMQTGKQTRNKKKLFFYTEQFKYTFCRIIFGWMDISRFLCSEKEKTKIRTKCIDIGLLLCPCVGTVCKYNIWCVMVVVSCI